MKLSDIKAAVRKTTGIEQYNPMQAAVAASDSRSLLLLAPTGSGKTIAFATAVLRRIPGAATPETESPQAVIIAPSRELVRQIYDVLRPVAAVFDLKTVAMYGGNPFAAEEASVKGRVPDIVVATPGRLLDHLNRGTMTTAFTARLVLDEYDKILELGFEDEMKRIVRRTGNRLARKVPEFVMVTSATRPDTVPEYMDLDKAEIVDFTETDPVVSRLRIVNVPSPSNDKLETLAALIRSIPEGPVIVFVNHRESADRVGQYLTRQHISNTVYHGGLDQQHREMALAQFALEGARVLVATDLAGRGLDIDAVTAVIHYHPAPDKATYTHRNGRTARVDRTGDVYVLTAPDQGQPEFVETENDFYPDMEADIRVDAPMQVVYFDRGKRDKLSRGDIAGFVMKKAGVPADCVGRIHLGNAYSLVAVSPQYADKVIDAARGDRIKSVRVRASIL